MKKIIIIAAVFAVFTVGIFYFVFLKMKGIQENRALTEQLAPELIEQLKEKLVAGFPYKPAPVEWQGKYLMLEHAGFNSEKYGWLGFSYNKEQNEKLNTDRFFPGNDINGVVWQTQGNEVVGHYEHGGNAYQIYYILFFIDLKQEIILAQDTVWGGMPPSTTRNTNGVDFGKAPGEEEIRTAIQNRIKS